MNQKKTKFIYLLALCFLVTQLSLGQTYSSEEESNNEAVTLNGTNVSEGVFNSFFDTNTASTPVQGSAVFLTQIGEDNQARVPVSAQASDINILQNGDNLTFERFGTNEISKNIKFTQTTASPTIIIRSFK